MKERIVERTVETAAARETVWRAITDPARLSQWFGDEAEVDLRPGGDGALTWHAHGRFAMRIDEVDPPRRLVWRWSHAPGEAFDEKSSTRVEWTLTDKAGVGTSLHLRETGFQTDEHQKENEGGWTAELGELVDLLGDPA